MGGGRAWERWQNEGSFGCEAVACALGQPNVPECAVGFHFFCLYAAKILLSFCRLFLSFYNERQRSAYMIRCGLRVASLSKSTEADAGNNADYQHRNRT